MFHFRQINLSTLLIILLIQINCIGEELDRILAVVEEDVVLESELEEQIFRVKEQIQLRERKNASKNYLTKASFRKINIQRKKYKWRSQSSWCKRRRCNAGAEPSGVLRKETKWK